MRKRYVGWILIALTSCGAPAPAPKEAAVARGPFDRDAFFRESDRVRREVSKCRQPGQLEGRSHVRFIFVPGAAEPTVSFEYGKYQGTPVGDCVLTLAKTVRVPPFEGRQESYGVEFVIGEDAGPPEGMFDRSSVAQALGGVDTLSCSSGPRVSGHARITFATDGTVLRAEVDQPAAMLGTPVASCVEAGFRAIHIRPFSGAPVTVGKTFSVGRGD